MKQISARAFREVFRTLDEPVQVSTRGEGGYVRIIGTWMPGDTAASVGRQLEAMRVVAGFGTSKPAPKPKAR